jgi:hypothetical protein
MTRTPLSMLPASATNMAVRAQSSCIASAGSDMAAYGRWSARLDQWMAHPEFDPAGFSRLCRVYKLD